MINVRHVGAVGILQLAHGKANALDIELCEAIARLVQESGKGACEALILTGTGSIFSAGVDLVQLLDGGPSYVRAFLPALTRAIDAIFFCPKPVIVALNGHAVAGGCVLACAGDRRLMTRQSGRIGLTELLVGVPFPTLAYEVVRFVIPAPHRLQEMVCTGATYSADLAAVIGLVDEVVDADALLDRAVEIAARLAALRPETFALTKRQSRQPVRDYVRSLSDVDAAVTELWAAPETSNRVRDYIARTFKPEFGDKSARPPNPARDRQ